MGQGNLCASSRSRCWRLFYSMFVQSPIGYVFVIQILDIANSRYRIARIRHRIGGVHANYRHSALITVGDWRIITTFSALLRAEHHGVKLCRKPVTTAALARIVIQKIMILSTKCIFITRFQAHRNTGLAQETPSEPRVLTICASSKTSTFTPFALRTRALAIVSSVRQVRLHQNIALCVVDHSIKVR